MIFFAVDFLLSGVVQVGQPAEDIKPNPLDDNERLQ
jgi:hypothetical protein